MNLTKLEDFIVNTDDVCSLMDLYATRIKSYPGNRAYYRALALQCGEFYLASRQLEDPPAETICQKLHQFAKLMDEKGITATTRQMELFIEEIHDLTAYLKSVFRQGEHPAPYSSRNLSLLSNHIRKFNSFEVSQPEPKESVQQGIVDDPFDEMEGFGDYVDAFLENLDDVFDSIIEKSGRPAVSPVGQLTLTDREQNEVESLFLSISGAYIQPVKDFIGELRDGSASKDWLDICLGSLRIIEDAGTKMSYDRIVRILERFKMLMFKAKESPTAQISRDIRLQLLKEYANLTALMPEAFATSDGHASRGTAKDSVIINAILRKTSGVGPISRNKIIAAGLNTLDKFFMASPRDLAAVSGITEAQAGSICQAFAEYKENLRTSTNLSTPMQVALTRLYKHLKELRTLHDEYKRVTRLMLHDPSYEDRQNRLRLSRQKCMWEISIILAELGALQLIEDFRKMIYDRRLQRLDEFIEAELKKHF